MKIYISAVIFQEHPLTIHNHILYMKTFHKNIFFLNQSIFPLLCFLFENFHFVLWPLPLQVFKTTLFSFLMFHII